MSSVVFIASAKTQSAPHSIYSPNRSMAAFIPSTFAASVRARIKNFSDFLASTAAFILSFASAHRDKSFARHVATSFGKTWSSMERQLTPVRSKAFTVK